MSRTFGTGDVNAHLMRQLVKGKRVRGNFSDHPRGVKRSTPPRSSIWPEGKVAKPGRMGPAS